MATITPHRDAVEKGLAAMREALPAEKSSDPIYALARGLTMALNDAAMRTIGDARDLGIEDPRIGPAVVQAIGNMMASICMTMADLDRDAARRVLSIVASQSTSHALDCIASADESQFSEVEADDTPVGRS